MKIISRDEYFMGIALKEADKAAALGEVPVGAVVVWKNKIVSQAFNTRETDKNALCHAEIKAIDEACRKLGGWRLFMCELFVTLEPCPMCAGAIINSRIKRVVFGARDEIARKVADGYDGSAVQIDGVHKGISKRVGGKHHQKLTELKAV